MRWPNAALQVSSAWALMRRVVHASGVTERMRERLTMLLAAMGLDPSRLRRTPSGIRRFVRDLRRYRAKGGDVGWRRIRPILHDFDADAGESSGHYFHQDLWAARLIYERRPSHHLDIGSRIDGFVAHLLTFMPVTVIDVRPLSGRVSGLSFIRADATDLAEIADDSVESLSSLHAVEHFGLGRYGDPIDPDAPTRAINAMARVLAPHGRLYLSAPIGAHRIEFNAHRIFNPQTIPKTCGLPLVSFAAVNDDGNLIVDARPEDFMDAHYACGLYVFAKEH